MKRLSLDLSDIDNIMDGWKQDAELQARIKKWKKSFKDGEKRSSKMHSWDNARTEKLKEELDNYMVV